MIGRSCRVGRREFDWEFTFGEGHHLVVFAPWRIVTKSGAVFADTDDGGWFGLPQPLDGEAKANTLLEGRTIGSVAADRATADICLRFDDGTRLDVFNSPSDPEGWQAQFPLGNQTVTLIGLRGGNVDFFMFETGSRPKLVKSQHLPRV